MEMKFTIVAIHGEGDRTTVNKLEAYRNRIEVDRYNAMGRDIPSRLIDKPDVPPDVLVILRDAAHDFRIEWPVKTWDEVEEWKGIAGWDSRTRHWAHGATVTVRIG